MQNCRNYQFSQTVKSNEKRQYKILKISVADFAYFMNSSSNGLFDDGSLKGWKIPSDKFKNNSVDIMEYFWYILVKLYWVTWFKNVIASEAKSQMRFWLAIPLAPGDCTLEAHLRLRRPPEADFQLRSSQWLDSVTFQSLMSIILSRWSWIHFKLLLNFKK
jgi:hypothetical protein